MQINYDTLSPELGTPDVLFSRYNNEFLDLDAVNDARVMANFYSSLSQVIANTYSELGTPKFIDQSNVMSPEIIAQALLELIVKTKIPFDIPSANVYNFLAKFYPSYLVDIDKELHVQLFYVSSSTGELHLAAQMNKFHLFNAIKVLLVNDDYATQEQLMLLNLVTDHDAKMAMLLVLFGDFISDMSPQLKLLFNELKSRLA